MPDPSLRRTCHDKIRPLDLQMGVASPLSVPAALEKIVLGGTDRLFALLDAAKIPGLVERLESHDKAADCLFRRTEELDDIAPWLVEIGKDDRLLRDFFTDVPGKKTALWTRCTGVLFRSPLPLPELRRHLRRFLRVEKENGQVYFFRFWESHVAQAYFSNLANRPALIDRWFRPREGGVISALLVPDAANASLWSYLPQDLPEGRPNPTGAFTLDASDMAAITYAHSEKRLADLTRLLVDTFPDRAAASDQDLSRMTRRIVGRMREFGLHQMDFVFVVLAWELFYGPGFETCDPTGELKRILHSDLNETDKTTALKTRMQHLEKTGISQPAET